MHKKNQRTFVSKSKLLLSVLALSTLTLTACGTKETTEGATSATQKSRSALVQEASQLCENITPEECVEVIKDAFGEDSETIEPSEDSSDIDPSQQDTISLQALEELCEGLSEEQCVTLLINLLGDNGIDLCEEAEQNECGDILDQHEPDQNDGPDQNDRPDRDDRPDQNDGHDDDHDQDDTCEPDDRDDVTIDVDSDDIDQDGDDNYDDQDDDDNYDDQDDDNYDDHQG